MKNEIMPIAQVRELANSALVSGLAGSVKNKDAMFVMMNIAIAENIHPIQAMNCYDLIQGRIALKANEALARFNDRGGRVKWLKTDKESAKALFTSKYNDPVEYEYTVEDATDAGLIGKDNWKKNLKAMLRKRCQVGGIRMSDPRALNNMYTSDEVADFDDEAIENSQVIENTEPTKQDNTKANKALLMTKLKKLNFRANADELREFYTNYIGDEQLEKAVSDDDFLIGKIEEFEDSEIIIEENK